MARLPLDSMARLLRVSILFVFVVSLMGCGGDSDESLVVYSGRSKALVDSLVSMYENKFDTPVEVKYGSDAQLLSALQEEGDQSPADVYWANTTGALGNAVANDLLITLPDSIMGRVPRYVPESKKWAPVTARFRVLAYNSDTVDPEDLPDSVLDLPDNSDLKGRVGWTPTYSSFQDFVTALRVTEGTDAARTWLEGMKELNPKSYTSNTPMVRALAAGEIDVALTNHYYVLRLKHGGAEGEYEGDEDEEEHEEEETVQASAPVEMYHFEKGDVGNLALVTGAGALKTGSETDAANRFIRFLLSRQAQSFAAHQVHEYPVRSRTDIPDYMSRIQGISPELEMTKLDDLDPTLELLREVGLL